MSEPLAGEILGGYVPIVSVEVSKVTGKLRGRLLGQHQRYTRLFPPNTPLHEVLDALSTLAAEVVDDDPAHHEENNDE